uniref:Uncharacterized protein n=1 Tax=Arundo donax TaxID=35708 RepID=A0A0A9GSX2_ARUDO
MTKLLRATTVLQNKIKVIFPIKFYSLFGQVGIISHWKAS